MKTTGKQVTTTSVSTDMSPGDSQTTRRKYLPLQRGGCFRGIDCGYVMEQRIDLKND
jgi:hypothetical protein